MSNPFSKEVKKFSIGIPVYGDTYENLDKCFKHLSEVEYDNFEVVVIFDGPHKKGVNKIKQIIKKYPKMDIQYDVVPHGGAAYARNECQKRFTGDYYSFSGGDYYYYPESLKIWANAFEEHPEVNRVWGFYDIVEDDQIKFQFGSPPIFPNGQVWYKAFKWSPYCDAAMPIRATAFIPWNPGAISLNDWEWSLRQLARDNFEGKDWLYIPHSFYSAEAPKPGGLSNDSATNWIKRRNFAQDSVGIVASDICVTSLGAQHHAFHVAEKLGADFLTMPSFKPHEYKKIYLLGFYTKEGQGTTVTQQHMDVFKRNEHKYTKIIHWIGTDVVHLRWNCSFEKIKVLKKWFKENNIIHLCESKQIQDELAEVGIKARIVPIPSKELNDPIPLPKKFSVGVYQPGSPAYKPELMDEVVRAMPDVQFYFFGDESRRGQKGDNWEQLGYIDIKKYLPKMSANLRITEHDGLPLIPIEFMTAGRNVITNVPLKGTIQVEKELNSIISGIRKAQENPLKLSVAKYWKKEMDFDKFVKTIRGIK